MDNFSKQIIAEQKYSDLRNQPIPDGEKSYNSPHFHTVEDMTIKPTHIEVKDTFSTEYKDDFDKASKDFWQKNTQNGIMKYNGGSLTANFGKEDYTITEFFKRLGKFVRESIRGECMDSNINSDELAENFKAVEVSLSLLANSITKLNPQFNVINVIAYIHGFINSYVSNTIKRKIERDKGKI